MNTNTKTTARKPEHQIARKQYAALAAHYGAIGSAAIRAALQFRKPATSPAVGKAK
ncbi:MAG: transcriptional regulator [Rhizobiaceae bacterium]|nr:transcriptional regulator [Rhizobiaceae bacterium]